MNHDNDVINGPCFSDRLGTINQAYCIKYSKWPSKARQWIERPRFCGWPPESLINNIVQGGVLLFSGTENDILHSKGLSLCESDLLPIGTNKTPP
jgi:hypothetical protein